MLYHSDRKVSQIFQRLGEDADNFESKFKYTVPKKEAIQLKIKMKLSVNQYHIMREFLRQYVKIPSYSTIAIKMKELYPTIEDPRDFLKN